MKKFIFGLVVAALLVSLVPTVVFADTVEDVPYLDEYGEVYTVDCTPLTGDMRSLESGWYVVQGYQQSAFRFDVTGDVNVILADGCTLAAKEGIHVPEGTSLTVYAQSYDNPGMIQADCLHPTNDKAAIGGNKRESSGVIRINSGVVNATVFNEYFGASNGAAIGGGQDGSGTVIINGGSVDARAWCGAGIGGGSGYGVWGGGGSGSVTINGGTVYASSKVGGAIGVGMYGDRRTAEIVINGGDIDAVSVEGTAFNIGGAGYVELTPPSQRMYTASSENGMLAASPYLIEQDILADVADCREIHLRVERMYDVEYILNMPDDLSHSFDLPKTVGNATLSLDCGEGVYFSGLACPVQKTMLSGEKPATITGGTGELFWAYDGKGLVKVDFVGWTDDAGNTYNIGDKPELTGDLTVYAMWSYDAASEGSSASILSTGSLAIVITVAAAAVCAVVVLAVLRKKKVN